MLVLLVKSCCAKLMPRRLRDGRCGPNARQDERSSRVARAICKREFILADAVRASRPND